MSVLNSPHPSDWSSRAVTLFLVCIWFQATDQGVYAGVRVWEDSNTQAKKLYEKCGESATTTTNCYGNADNCVKKKSCFFLVQIIDVGHRFNVTFLSSCSRQGLNDTIFIAAAAAPFNNNGDLDCSKDLKMTDLKVFVFWNVKDCNSGNKTLGITKSGVNKETFKSSCEEKWESEPKKKYRNTLAPNQTNTESLNVFLNDFVRFHTVAGDWAEANRPFNFPKNMSYKTSADQVCYMSNYFSNSSPKATYTQEWRFCSLNFIPTLSTIVSLVSYIYSSNSWNFM